MADGTISINNYDLNRLRQKSAEAIERKKQSDKELEMARKRLEEAVQEMRQHSGIDSEELRQAALDEERRIYKDLDDIDASLRRELYHQNSEFRSELDDIRRTVSKTDAEISRVNERITQVSNRFNQRIKQLTERIREQKESAIVYQNELQKVTDSIRLLHPELLAPGEADLIEEALTYINTDIEQEDYQAALGLAQSHLPTAVALLSTLERKNDEYNVLRTNILNEIVNVRERMSLLLNNDANAHDSQIQIGAEQFAFRYNGDLNHWSSGLFFQLYDDFAAFEDNVLNDYLVNMDLENMRMASVNIQDYLNRLETCVSFAESEFEISCIVQGTASIINEALTSDETWDIVNSGFDNNDDRLSYSLVYTDGQANDSVITILPELIKQRDTNAYLASYSIGTMNGRESDDEGLCTILHDAITRRLETFGVNGESRNISENANNDINEFFIIQSKNGNKIKDERVRLVKRQIKL